MNRKKTIQHLVCTFEENIRNLSDKKLERLAGGKLKINLIQPVGKEAGGYGIPTNPAAPSPPPLPRGPKGPKAGRG
ncbi:MULTISPECIES: hypothetical protein [Legionella]|uniref:Uncharacterized protein n=1 Tax=Legionella maceachernii TaxID=466 RepID=A0A0W0VXD1_9GAMM|nr:hypothetical protein [Legionella maceachernii]KTD24675.1 hypothetical protein Lmac_2762 [Legionella maceachernii]SKA26556.1 hypothetical protein SAMN02745128_02908 [Legionella maceachernii]SUP01879.1 Uncharacterised protein [Legionella maceachernii]